MFKNPVILKCYTILSELVTIIIICIHYLFTALLNNRKMNCSYIARTIQRHKKCINRHKRQHEETHANLYNNNSSSTIAPTIMPPENKYERQSKCSRNSLTLTVWCIMVSYRLDSVLVDISTCKFYGGSGATSGRYGQWFLHHDNASSHTSLVVQQFLSSPSHRTLRISLPVAFGSSLHW
jgi:hypothetical protein